MTTTNRTIKARIVKIKIEEDKSGLFFATSPDLVGLLVAEPTLDALIQAVPDAIADLYAACGEKVVVTPVEREGRDRSYVAVPAEIARKALEHHAIGD